ncbi:somatostatin receptor type 4-like [Strongylocentrotus purpuratus]|uniref:G-protein coupled receptors family 1 profile domain-containing protein n=1 Tax=Strongylocentrotus purpuratus TaxID=7668 RepID=A0A7M7NZH7_STRPU|nr:somatostatin receptor type 4 [Strongylocentrotus purpuratus]XP_030842996.1 somatostatin receptor type 4-like [Strongylocentrotus purpuratus]|eukprot:XP_003729106.2 PREDICTED: somatostatin receptor type 4 [Strongylocentrotus purpuratus]
MMAIAIDRFFAVRIPVLYKGKFTVSRTKFVLLFVWLTSFTAALPVAFMFESIYSGEGQAISYPGKLPWACKAIVPFGPWWKDFKPVYLNILLFYIPVIITAIIYVRIVVHVKRSNQYLRSELLNGGPVPKRYRNSHWKICKSLLYVFVGFIICFAPFATYHIVQQYFSTALHPELKNLSLLLPYVNSCFNPVIYSFTNDTFWKAAKQIVCMSTSSSRDSPRASLPSTDMDGGHPPSFAAISGNQKRKRVDGERAMGIAFSYERNMVEMEPSPDLARHHVDTGGDVDIGINGTMSDNTMSDNAMSDKTMSDITMSDTTRSSEYCMTTIIPNGKA